MDVLPFLGMCLMVLESYVYTIAAYFYAFRLAFSSILHCVLHDFTLRLAPKRTAFCTILHYILLKIAPKQVQLAVVWNKYSFCCIRRLAPFSTKTNLRENRLFAANLAIGGEKGSHSVKIRAQKMTKDVAVAGGARLFYLAFLVFLDLLVLLVGLGGLGGLGGLVGQVWRVNKTGGRSHLFTFSLFHL